MNCYSFCALSCILSTRDGILVLGTSQAVLICCGWWKPEICGRRGPGVQRAMRGRLGFGSRLMRYVRLHDSRKRSRLANTQGPRVTEGDSELTLLRAHDLRNQSRVQSRWRTPASSDRSVVSFSRQLRQWYWSNEQENEGQTTFSAC